jgi:murein L,D-transpeptidase YcbB/YkuD
VPFTIRQRPGKDNPLGKFKFFLSNSYRIYLHDSNEPYLFDESRRAFSHGCIRVEKARLLAEYLLRNQKGGSPERLDKLLSKKSDYGLKLDQEMPVYIVYLTSWVNEKGEVNFRNDVYHLDEELGKVVFGD